MELSGIFQRPAFRPVAVAEVTSTICPKAPLKISEIAPDCPTFFKTKRYRFTGGTPEPTPHPCECTRISCLDHANVVKLRGVVINVNTFLPILVTEQLGSPLSEYLLKEHPKPTTQMRTSKTDYILRDVAHGLQYLHCLPNPVLHLCLTPENIVINPDTCQAKICNPGVVNLLQLNPSWCRSNLPRADCFLPELEDTKLDPSIDIFSYGALMIHVFQPQQEPICPPVFLQDPQDSNKIIMGAFVTVDKVMATGASAAILCKVLESHPMYSLVQKCLMKLPSARPTIINVVNELENKVFIFL